MYIIDAEARHDYYYYYYYCTPQRRRKEPRPCQLHAIRVVVVLLAAAAADERNLNWETTAAMPSGGSGTLRPTQSIELGPPAPPERAKPTGKV